MIFAIKKSLLFIPLIIIAIAILFVSPWNRSSRQEVSSVPVDSLSDQTLELRDSLAASIDSLKMLKPEVARAVRQLKEYKEQVKQYEQQEADIVIKKVVDSSALMALRNKLNSANNEIARLSGELASVRYKPGIRTGAKEGYTSFVQPAVETPDENSIVITLDGRSKKGDIPTTGLTIYLIPYRKKAPRELMVYDSSCNELFATAAQYYNGVYFFNNVPNGKYLIKICTYLGNYKLIKKDRGKYNVTMQVSPPIQ